MAAGDRYLFVQTILENYNMMDDHYGVWFDYDTDDNIDNIQYQDYYGNFVFLKIGTDGPKIKKIHDSLYKINTLSVTNLIVEKESIELQFGSLDWNNRILYAPNSGRDRVPVPSNIFYNSAYNNSYEENLGRLSSSSINLQTYAVNANSAYPVNINLNKRFIDFGFVLYSSRLEDYFIDFFCSENIQNPYYMVSFSGDYGFYTYLLKENLQEAIWVQDNVNAPLSIQFESNKTTSSSQIVTVSKGVGSLLFQYQGYNIENYYYKNLLFNIGQMFNILGTNYMYDEQYIFLINISNGDIVNRQEVARAYGFQFLGNSYTQAFFYNTYDKMVYSFSGDRRLTPIISLSNKPTIVDSYYSVAEDQLYLLCEYDNFISEILMMRHGQMYSKRLISDISQYDLFDTIKGMYIGSSKNQELFKYQIQFDPTIINDDPLHFKTEYLGIDQDTLVNLKGITIRIDKNNEDFTDSPIVINYGVNTLNSDNIDIDPKTLELTAKDFEDKRNHINIKYIPKFPVGLGHQLYFDTDSNIKVTQVDWNAEPVAKQPVKGAHSL